MQLTTEHPDTTATARVRPPLLQRIRRKSAVLRPSALDCISHAPTINVTQGCAHRCIYCYARAYSNYPGDGCVQLYANLADKLEDELRRKRRPPDRVYFSSSTDCFGPYAELQEQTFLAMQRLLRRGIAIEFLTKGVIAERFFPLFEEHAPRLDAQIGLMTLDASVLQTIEPLAATREQRLANIRSLRAIGVRTAVRIDPIFPGLTDTPEALERLFTTLAELRVTRISASYLFLRPGIRRRLAAELHPTSLRRRILKLYDSGPRIVHRASPDGRGVIALPRTYRMNAFARLREAAARFGIRVSVCRCKNSDLPIHDCCNATGMPRAAAASRQLLLFDPTSNDPAGSPACRAAPAWISS